MKLLKIIDCFIHSPASPKEILYTLYRRLTVCQRQIPGFVSFECIWNVKTDM